MNDFSQNGIVANLHDFSFKRTKHIEDELLNFSKYNKMELILPCLYSELEGSALPKILDEISKAKYLNHVIIGLDRADNCLLYTSPSPRDLLKSRMPSSA